MNRKTDCDKLSASVQERERHNMISDTAKKLFDEINSVVSSSLNQSESFNSAQNQFRASLEHKLRQLNLVTREEFDAQQAVLHRTREKLELLEKKVAELEENLKQEPGQENSQI